MSCQRTKKCISYHQAFFFCIVLSVWAGFGQANVSNQPAASLDVNTILQRWENNYRGITSMRVSYYEKVIAHRPPADEPNIVPNLLMHSHVERIEKGRLYHIRHSMTEDGFTKPENITEHAFDGVHTQDYWGRDKWGTIQKGPLNLIMAGSTEGKINDIKKYMLLDIPPIWTASGFPTEVDPNGTPRFSQILTRPSPDTTTLVKPGPYSVAREPCHVIEITHKEIGIVYRIWIAHEKGMLVMKYQLYGYRGLIEEIEVEQISNTQTDGRGIWYPAVAYRTLVVPYKGTIRYKIVTYTFVPNITVDENTFRFDFPSGTSVRDRESGLEYVVGDK
jgi:hypothetical protein